MIPVEAIERVIDDLETEKKRASEIIAYTEIHGHNFETLIGRAAALQYAIQELQKVLSEYAR